MSSRLLRGARAGLTLAASLSFIAPFASLALVACGGDSSRGRADVAGNNVSTNDAAHMAQQVNEPRRGDATASGPAATSVTTGVAVPVGRGASSASPGPSGAAAAKSTASPGSEDPAGASGAEGANAAMTPEPPRKISARHVLVQWMGSDRAGKSVLRTREQAMVLAQEVLKRAKAGDDLGRLAVEYSDEPNADARGGSLGRFAKGQMVGPFEQVAFKLKVGEVSEIVETPFGFHIIQRTE